MLLTSKHIANNCNMKKILPLLLFSLFFTYSHAQEDSETLLQKDECWRMLNGMESAYVFEKMVGKYICSYGTHTDKNMRKARALAYYDALKNLLPCNYAHIAEYVNDTLQIAFNSSIDLMEDSTKFDKCNLSYYTGPSLYVSNYGQCKFYSAYINELWIEFANERARILCDEVVETADGYRASCTVDIIKEDSGTIIEDFYDYSKKKLPNWFK